MANASDFILPTVLMIAAIAWWRDRRRDKSVLALQDKLIAEQKLLLSNADEVIAGLNGRLQYAARDHQVTIQSYERLLDRREAKDSDSARPDIDAVMAERRARPGEFIVHAGKLDSASLAEFKRAWNATDPDVKLVIDPKEPDDAA